MASRGVRAATTADARYTIECLHNAATTAEVSSKQLLDLVLRKSPQKMRDTLASADCAVSNMRDKETLLPVVGQTDEHVRQMMSEARTSPAPALVCCWIRNARSLRKRFRWNARKRRQPGEASHGRASGQGCGARPSCLGWHGMGHHSVWAVYAI